jgi:hypothetical protein
MVARSPKSTTSPDMFAVEVPYAQKIPERIPITRAIANLFISMFFAFASKLLMVFAADARNWKIPETAKL